VLFHVLVCDAMAGRATVTRVDITSEASGPGREEPYQAAVVVLQRSEGGFRRTGTLQTGAEKVVMTSDIVPEAAVEHLADLLDQPAQTDLSLEQLGANVPREVLVSKLATIRRGKLSDDELTYLDTMLRTPGTLTRGLRLSFQQLHQDLAPRIQVRVSLSDGRTLATSSRSHQPLMLPWAVSRGASWNTDIPASVRALLPARDPNIDLLDVPDLKKEGANILAASLAGALAMHETEQSMPGLVQALRARFDLYEVNPDPRRGDPVSDSQPVAATVRLLGGPANLWAKLTLRAKDGHLVDEPKVDTFRDQMTLAATSPVIRTLADEDKGDIFIMELPQPSSAELSEEFRHVPGLTSLASWKDIAQGAMALQFYTDRLWLVLPDHRTVSFPNPDLAPPITAADLQVFAADGQPMHSSAPTPSAPHPH
jgi:hypothetical protein